MVVTSISTASEQQSSTFINDTTAIGDEPSLPATVDNVSGAVDQQTLIYIIVGSVLGCLLVIAVIAGIIVALKRRQVTLREPTAPNQRTSEYASSSILGAQYDKVTISDTHHYEQPGSSLRF